MYLVIGTRPDSAFTVSLLSQYSSQPTTIHMGAAKRVLPYPKGTRDKFLTYTKCSALSLAGFADADFANDKDDRISISSHIFQLAINTISWGSRKQKCVSTSTIEAVYISTSLAAKQQLWLQYAVKELGFTSIPSALSTDGEGAVDLTQNPRISNRSKHIHIAYHHICDLVETGKLVVLHVPDSDNLGDICTKAMPGPIFFVLRDSVLGVK